MARRQYSEKTLKLLWGNSYNLCAFPDCTQNLCVDETVYDQSVICGEISHIVGHSKEDGPRSDPTFPRGKVNLQENLILFCPTHHTLVDKQPNTYTAFDLRQWKKNHEEKVRRYFSNRILSINASEFEQVLKYILHISSTKAPSEANKPTNPTEKMKKNQLTDSVRLALECGMLRSHDVEQYIQHEAILDSSFPERLRDSFKDEYNRLKSEGKNGNELFFGILKWAQQGRGQDISSAVYPVITYLFESCELFEP